MKTLKLVGFFKDLPYGLSTENSLKDLVGEQAHVQEQNIINYLKSGKGMIAGLGYTYDILSDKELRIGTDNVLTDGEWAWHSDLSYYVNGYHIKLPDDFIEHMANNLWQVPQQICLESIDFPSFSEEI